jgi:hypothetical protein
LLDEGAESEWWLVVSAEQDDGTIVVLLQHELVYPGVERARADVAAPLTLGDSLPFHLAKLNTFVFKCNGLVQKPLERWKGVRHQLVLEWPNKSL